MRQFRTRDFDYHLPRRAIAQPPPHRDRSRLLVLDRKSGRTAHRTVRDLPELLQRGDLLVVNDTKVFRARLHGTVGGKPIELLLVRPINNFSPSSRGGARGGDTRSGRRELEGVGSAWLALGKPGRRLRVGATVTMGKLRGIVRAREDDGSIRIAFNRSPAAVIAYANRTGEVPVPPYVKISPPPAWRGSGRGGGTIRLSDYQTSYARHVGSVAAPTAGFHLTPQLRRALQRRGIRIARVTLHVGLGTFQPMRTERIEDHLMHAEWAEVPAATIRLIDRTKQSGSRVIAVGTTTLRTLEGAAHAFSPSSTRPGRSVGGGGARGGASQRAPGEQSMYFSPSRREGEREGVGDGNHALTPHRGWLNLFITPGFHFRVVDALLTNFHLPKSTLLVLVSAFSAPGQRNLRGRDLMLRAYRSALRHGYRFYSFGDAMFIHSSSSRAERSAAERSRSSHGARFLHSARPQSK